MDPLSKTGTLANGAAPSLTELTFRGIVLGALITLVFTASNVYLGLKVGLTFSSSIPAVVISLAALSFFSNTGILENNMVQTQASAAGTLSAVIFALPAVLMVGYWQSFDFLQTMLVCFAGGTLGVVFSIPLRRTMVVNSDLPYPEGVAAGEILIASYQEEKNEDEGSAKDIVWGGVFASAVSVLTTGLHVLADKSGLWFSGGRVVTQVPIGFSLALVSAGYLMGITAGAAMFLGLFIAWGVCVPVLSVDFAREGLTVMELGRKIWTEEVRFIGTGVLSVAALWTLITLAKPMVEGIRLSVTALRGAGQGRSVPRTDQDLSMRTTVLVGLGALALLGLTFHSFISEAPIAPALGWGLVLFAVIAVFLIGFVIATACGYMAGLIGSSNSPISGIGIIAVLVISFALMFLDSRLSLFMGPEGTRFGMALALFITTAVVSVATISNDNLQDLKTGFIVGATPRNQQIALIIGCFVGAAIIAPTLGVLYEVYGFSGAALPRPGMNPADALSAPQATLMMTVAKGIFSHSLEWGMILLGAGLGVGIIILDTVLGRLGKLRISALAVGLGIYLEPTATAAIIVGSILSVLIKRRLRAKDAANNSHEAERNKKGVLIASGFIVGESLTGVLLAVAVLVSLSMGGGDAPFAVDGFLSAVVGSGFGLMQQVASGLVFIAACVLFYRKST